jgi:hypothetical protein
MIIYFYFPQRNILLHPSPRGKLPQRNILFQKDVRGCSFGEAYASKIGFSFSKGSYLAPKGKAR